jgi:thiamine biosynthesis lipoprotein
MHTVTLACRAMNTRFELVLHGGNAASLRAAGEEALREVERLEGQLSLFRPGSDIARVNALAARESVRVLPETFALLEHAQRMSIETGGAFDITMAPLLRCWGLLGSSDGRVPTQKEIAAARAVSGVSLVELERASFTVRFTCEGVMLDLGAIGKGYAVDKAVELLREAGVESALIHAGTSTVFAIGQPPDAEVWKVAIDAPSFKPTPDPSKEGNSFANASFPSPLLGGVGGGFPASQATPALTVIPLRDESLSVSAVSGKCFVANGRTLGHIIDPRTGEPASRAVLSAVVLPSATETDALSTALLVVGPDGHGQINALRSNVRSLVVGLDNVGTLRVASRGLN